MRSGKHRKACKKISYINFNLSFLKDDNYCNNDSSSNNSNSNKLYVIIPILSKHF